MTSRLEGNDHSTTATEQELGVRFDDPGVRAWFGEHQAELRRSIVGHHFLRLSLAIGFAIGLVAHISGYLLRSATLTEPFGLVADLLYALGLALWTGAVVVVFVEVIPEAKERQIRQALRAYEAARRQEGPAPGGESAQTADQARSAGQARASDR